jgi:hypothetical protein
MKTPGVYVVEKNAFPNSVVEVATAVPAFIGYTAIADNNGTPIAKTPWRISSMSEFQTFFGGPPPAKFGVTVAAGNSGAFSVADDSGNRTSYSVTRDVASVGFQLYYNMMLFFMNGGGPCWIVSVGDYTSTPAPGDLTKGIDLLLKEMEPTMVVIPDALLLAQDACITVQQAALAHCGRPDVRSRVAILDIYNGYQDQTNANDNCITQFRNALGTDNLNYAAAYYPWLNASVVADTDIGYQNLSSLALLQGPLVPPQVAGMLGPPDPASFTLGFLDKVKNSLTGLSGMTSFTAAIASSKAPAPGVYTATPILSDLASADLTTLAATDVPGAKALLAPLQATQPDPATFTLGFLDKLNKAGVTAPPGAKAFADLSKSLDLTPFTAQVVTDAQTAVQALLTSGAGGAPTLKDVQDAISAAGANVTNAATAEAAAANAFKPKPGLTSDQKAAAQLAVGVLGIPPSAPVTGAPDVRTTMLNNTLAATSPFFVKLRAEMKRQLNLLPPSGALAGVYTRVDNTLGVWRAPANVSLNGVVSPAVNITDAIQEDLNVSIQGKSINAIRSFVGEGTLVWGARTLDGNSLDWRYVNVRRTMIFLEQSVKSATKAYVFENNVATTWVTVKSMIRNFLTSVWKRGGLAGASPDDAFQVLCGLGETMVAQDILDGILRVTVLVALVRPAEFIEITFQQQMQKS